MELFNECKNKYFHMVLKIINMACDGISENEIIKIIDNEEFEEKLITKDFKIFSGMILNKYDSDNLNLLRKKDDRYFSVLQKDKNIPLKIRFTALEKEWIKTMLKDKNVQALCGRELYLKLADNLKDVMSYEETIDFTNKNERSFEYDYDNLNKIIFLIIRAIKENKTVIYTNTAGNGRKYKNVCGLPLRIEYSLKDDTFRCSIYSIEEDRPILINLHTISEIKISETVCEKSRHEILLNMKNIKYCEEPVTIILHDIRGAMERCFMSFSSFKRNSRMIDKNTYEIDIYYYSFQEHDVISKIMSLGPYAVIKGPQRMKNLIIEKIKKACL